MNKDLFPFAATSKHFDPPFSTRPTYSDDDFISSVPVTPPFVNDPIDTFSESSVSQSHTTPPTTAFSPTSSTTSPTQLPSPLEDYITPNQPFHPATQSSLQANTILLTYPIDADKYNFSHYSPPTPVFVCVVSK